MPDCDFWKTAREALGRRRVPGENTSKEYADRPHKVIICILNSPRIWY